MRNRDERCTVPGYTGPSQALCIPSLCSLLRFFARTQIPRARLRASWNPPRSREASSQASSARGITALAPADACDPPGSVHYRKLLLCAVELFGFNDRRSGSCASQGPLLFRGKVVPARALDAARAQKLRRGKVRRGLLPCCWPRGEECASRRASFSYGYAAGERVVGINRKTQHWLARG
jgi:hypothetical protein